jgi:hypothetical protein
MEPDCRICCKCNSDIYCKTFSYYPLCRACYDSSTKSERLMLNDKEVKRRDEEKIYIDPCAWIKRLN